ncbi:MAG: ribosomal protein S18-alanine N-acetyltransferase [Candidatus Heimdallarchaeota archaeon]|nr:MAG: ribosomal protein S18-alanine N-acetyltransferase [Candidatus Heimdallarchaeota archaeon]
MTEQSSVIFRRFELKDLDQVMEINKQTLPENYPERFFRTIFSELPSAFLICEINGDVVGYTMARLEKGLSHYSIFHRAKKGHTVSVAVKPEYRRRGLATKLLKGSINAMIEHGATELFLEVRVSNSAAVNLYKSLGYEILKEIRHYYRNYESAYLMVQKITKNSKKG